MNRRHARAMSSILALGAMILGGCGVLSSQEIPAGKTAPSFRVESSSSQGRHGATKIDGYVYNDYGSNAGNFQLLVVGLDERGQVVSKRVVPVLGTVTPMGRMYFSIPAPGPAASYQVSVYWYEWIARGV